MGPSHSPFDLSGRVAIVTGAARGIGLASAQRLQQAGARVLLCDLDPEALASAARSIPGDIHATALDLTHAEVPEAIVAEAIARWGRLDIVFNNAGYNWDAALVDMSDDQFQAMLDIHVLAPLRLLRAAGRHFAATAFVAAPEATGTYRKVITTSSVSGTMGNPRQANYNAAKAAVVGITKGLAKEWGAYRVNVNAIAPGFIDTRLTALAEDAGTIDVAGRTIALGISASHRRNGSEMVALGRPGTPDEVARVVLFLASEASDYVTGQVISVTGGLALGMTS
jgi:3-oxoacyl-[acyl-carrier protein] reductase